MSLKVGIFVFIVCLVNCINSEGHYSIVGSKTLRPNTVYKVAVSSHDEAVTSTIKVKVTGLNGAAPYSVDKTITVQPKSTELVELEIKNVNLTNCKLEAEGTAGIIFKNSTDLEFISKSFSLYILTDKAAYKPGDKVMFRVIILDANLLPAPHTTGLNILITDGTQNEIKQYTNENTKKGVFSGEFELSDSPVLGQWTFNVTYMNTNTIKNIYVEEYELPDFEVLIDTERHNTFQAGQIKVSVRGKYTFGKLADGEITVTAFATRFIGSTTPANEDAIVKKQISTRDGNIAEFDIKNELKAVDDEEEEEYDQYAGVDVIIKAEFVENLTGRKQKASTTVSLHRSKYLLTFISDYSGYKLGLTYEAWVKVTYHNGAPVTDIGKDVILTYIYENHTIVDNSRKDENGLAQFDFEGPSNFVPKSIKAKYLDACGTTQLNTPDSRTKSDNQVFIQAKVKTNTTLSVNKEATIQIESTEVMKSITYVIIGRGQIIKSETIPVTDSRFGSFTFTPTFAMVPKTHLIVYYVHTDGQIVFDSIELKLPSVFQNNIKVDLTAARSKPGKDIDINIKARPHSFVGILAVDQRVLLYKKGNDLSIDDIFGDLKHYESKPVHNFESFYEFVNTGTVILTNCKPPHVTEDDGDGEPIAREIFGDDIIIRRNFPETWIWETIDDIGWSGRKTLHKKVPDTITSFILTAFAIDTEFGFGMIPIPKKLEVFQQFFITTRLPYSIKQGEIVTIPIIVFNYLNVGNVRARVTLHNDLLEFDFVDDDASDVSKPVRIENSRYKDINAKENTGTALYFKIKPKVHGYIKIKITAECEHMNDGLEKKLLVIPEGVTQKVHKTVLIDLRLKNSFDDYCEIDIPTTSITGSICIDLTVFGNIWGTIVTKINHYLLIRIPCGCGEQVMITMVPNICILIYLKITGQQIITPYIENLSLQYLKLGYQNALRYRQKDGSFATWANYKGTTWLTAYVIRYFTKGSQFIYIDEAIISKGLQWLSTKQSANGAFPEVGPFLHKEMQSESGGGISLTAFTLISFLENDKYRTQYAGTITKAMDYIAANISPIEDVYPLAICAYALQLGKHASRDTVLNKLISKANTKDDFIWWSRPTRNWRFIGANAVHVEITAYALLAYIAGNRVSDARPIVNWLATQVNGNGFFHSTQDTVVALQALSMYPATTAGLAANYNVHIIAKHNNNQHVTFDVNKNNAMKEQTKDLPPETRGVNITATGTGVAMARIGYQYNIVGAPFRPKFSLTATVNPNTTDDYIHLTVCTRYLPDGTDTFSGLAIVEIQLPSGYKADKKSFTHKQVKNYETKEDNTIIQMHFQRIDGTTVCPYVAAYRQFDVKKLKAVPVTVYDYYDHAKRARVFYQVKQPNVIFQNDINNEVCDQEACEEDNNDLYQ